jgi:2-oxoisovalerate dehydrogenase E1 component
MMLSFVGASEDPVSGGRHKVLGSHRLFVPPQTSTIASHLPKAMGTAFSIPRARDLGIESVIPYDGLVYCSFGDASANHSTALGALNTASWMAVQGVPVPIVFVCEDNGIGVSVRTPTGWIRENFSKRPGLTYIECDGLSIPDTFAAAAEAAHVARELKKPVFLHMHCVRLGGHAGSDVEEAYRTQGELSASESNDPLLHSARIAIEQGILSGQQILQMYEASRARIQAIADAAVTRPKPKDAAEVMSSIIPPVRPPKRKTSPPLNGTFEIPKGKQHLARLMTAAIGETLARFPEAVVFGEDVGKKGGVYGVTVGLQKQFGIRRVFDSLLDEQSILGTAIGMAQNGFLPIPEIQFLAYVHNAEDQIRGEAATLSYFSQGKFTNPMVIRIAGLAYQKGFGGHFHNDNSLTIFRDIPGVIVAVPSNGQDAVKMWRECVRLARDEQRVVVFVEPIALYMTRDLHEKGDGAWTFEFPGPEEGIRLSEFGVTPGSTPASGENVILTYGNGVYLSHQAIRGLKMRPKVIDLRWIQPIDEVRLIQELKDAKRVLIVEECRKTGSLSEYLVTLLAERATGKPAIKRIAADDSFIALGIASTHTLPSKNSIAAAAQEFFK